MRASRLTAATVLLLLVLPMPGIAQQEASLVYDFELEAPSGATEVPLGSSATALLNFRDLSRSGPRGIAPELPGVDVESHRVSWQIDILSENPKGWLVVPPSPFTSHSGEEREVRLTVRTDPTTQNPYLQVNVTARIATTYGGTFERSVYLLFHTPGLPSHLLVGKGALQLQPREVGHAAIEIRNIGVFRQAFDFEVASNPCDLRVVAPATTVVEPKGSRLLPVTVQAPEERFRYNYESCTVSFTATPAGGGHSVGTVLSVVVNGFYVDPVWVFWTVGILLALMAIALLVKGRKERLEEELLGKPQRPWTIPVEKVYLDRLREKDPRAWYVVRHHLMEEEYRSALLWYRNEKRATKANREKERVILREERRYRAWQKDWEKQVARPVRKAQRFEARLQKKLDRRSRKNHRKALAAWKAETAKLQKKHAERLGKLNEKWEKQAAKAAKKGREAPPKPELPAPELPEEPQPVPLVLAEHRWNRKAARFRRRMERRQGTLEVRYEKADARRHRKVVRRLRRLADKLDDPAFIEEHPLLSETA